MQDAADHRQRVFRARCERARLREIRRRQHGALQAAMVHGGENRLGAPGGADARAQADHRLVKVKPRFRRAEPLTFGAHGGESVVAFADAPRHGAASAGSVSGGAGVPPRRKVVPGNPSAASVEVIPSYSLPEDITQVIPSGTPWAAETDRLPGRHTDA